MDRVALARAVRAEADELTPGRGPDSARRLFHLVRDQAMPGAHDGLTADDVLAELGAPELVDLYPAPPQLPDLPDPLPAPAPRHVAEAVTGPHVPAHRRPWSGRRGEDDRSAAS